MYAACFGLYLDHPEPRQYKNLTNEDAISFACVFEITSWATLQVWKGHVCGPHFANPVCSPLIAVDL